MNKQQSNIIHLETEREEGVKYMELLLAAETAILNYARKHGNLIKNPYWFFSEKLGYKSKNFLYGIFQNRENHKLTIEALRKIYEITQDAQLKNTWQNYL